MSWADLTAALPAGMRASVTFHPDGSVAELDVVTSCGSRGRSVGVWPPGGTLDAVAQDVLSEPEAIFAILDFASPPPFIRVPDPHRISPALRREIYERDGYRCQECGTDERLSIDHVIPRSAGGLTVRENLQTLCSPCNSRKGARVS